MKISEIVGEAKLSGQELDAAIAQQIFPSFSEMKNIRYSARMDLAYIALNEMRLRWRTKDSEELYWQITDCQEYGWRVDVMWSHHDGDVPVQECERDQELPVAICRAALRWVTEPKGGAA